MAGGEHWFDICSLKEAAQAPLRRVKAANVEFAVSFKDARVGVVSNTCNHVGGPLAKAGWTGSTSNAHGTAGNSTGAPGTVNPG